MAQCSEAEVFPFYFYNFSESLLWYFKHVVGYWEWGRVRGQVQTLTLTSESLAVGQGGVWGGSAGAAEGDGISVCSFILFL